MSAIEQMVRLLAGVIKGTWRHTTRWEHKDTGAIITPEQYKALTDDARKAYGREYAIATPETVNAGDSLVVTKRTGEIALFVLNEQLGWQSRNGERVSLWLGTQLNPFTGEPMDQPTSTTATELL